MINIVDAANSLQDKNDLKTVPASLFKRTSFIGIKEIPFDLFISESHTLEFQLSDHPLQNGCVISDHVQQKLRSVTIKGMFSNHSMSRRSSTDESIDVQSENKSYAALENVALRRYEELEKIAKKKEPIRLVTSIIDYPQMIISEIRTERNNKSGSAITFTMTLREVKLVELKETISSFTYKPDSMDDAASRLVSPQSKVGLKSGEEKTAKEMQKLLNVEVAK